MNQPNGRQSFMRAVEGAHRQVMEVNPLQKALDDYHLMEHERDAARYQAAELRATNAALLAETNMLREAYERADTDRIRLQTVASTLLGRLLAINDCIGGAVRASVKDGIEAVHASKAEDELEQDANEIQAVLQRIQPQQAPEIPPQRTTSPEPPQPVSGAMPPQVEWRT